MTYIVRVRRRRGVWWWSTSLSRPRTWNGPWRTYDEADRAATDSIVNYRPTMTGPDIPKPQGEHDARPDLRQAAWAEWAEMRS